MALAPARAAEIDGWLAEARDWADRALERLLPAASAEPARLHEAMRYAVFGGAKRLRPALVRLTGAHLGALEREAELAAAAVECVHTYSLVHDDLPCMDDDDLRRGRPTLHKVFGEALAVLAGDALLTHAFALLARAGPLAPDLVAVLADAAGSRGMVGGQDLDLAGTADERPAGVPGAARLVTDSARPAHPAAPPAGQSLAQTVARIHELKTARLFGAAAEMGAICARARPAERAAARGFGLALGRSFQAVDDVLDVTGDAASLGKTPGKDERAGKLTLVAALGLVGARAEARRLGGEARAAAAALGLAPGDLGSDLVDHLLGRRA